MLRIPPQFAARLVRIAPRSLEFSNRGPHAAKVAAWLLVADASLWIAVSPVEHPWFPAAVWIGVGCLALAVLATSSHELSVIFDSSSRTLRIRLREFYVRTRTETFRFDDVSVAIYEAGVLMSHLLGDKWLEEVRALVLRTGEYDVVLATGRDVDKVAGELSEKAGLGCRESPNWFRIRRESDFRNVDPEARRGFSAVLALLCSGLAILLLTLLLRVAQRLGE